MHVPRDTHMAEMISDMSGQPKMGRTYSNILDNFNQLKDSNPSVRLNGGVALLNYIHQHNMVNYINNQAAFHLILTMFLESFHSCHLSNVKQGMMINDACDRCEC